VSLIVAGLPRYYFDHKQRKRYPIYRRMPQLLSSKLILPVGANSLPLPTGDLTNSRDLPFEFTEVIPVAAYLDSSDNPIQTPPALALPGGASAPAIFFTQITIQDTSENQPVIENPTEIAVLVNQDSGLWNLPKPYYLPTEKEWQVTGTNLHTSQAIQLYVTLRGSYLILGKGVPFDGPEGTGFGTDEPTPSQVAR